MGLPVINQTQSVLGFLQHQTFNVQLAADVTVTWDATNLPTGVSLNTSTGLISGAATYPGVYNVDVVAIGGDESAGSSDRLTLVFEIEAASATASGDVDVTIDLVSGRVTLTIPPPLASAGAAAAPAELFVAKYDTDLIFRLRFVKAGVAVDLDMTDLTWTMKRFDTDAVLVTSTGWKKYGTGSDATYRVHAKLTGDALLGALSDYAKPKGTRFTGRGEFEWTANNADTTGWTGTVPSTLDDASDTFLLTIAASQTA